MDEKLIDQFISDKQAVIEDVNTDVDIAYEALEELRKIMLFKGNRTAFTLADFFRFCAAAISSVEPSVYVTSTEPQLEETATTNNLPLTTNRSISFELSSEEELYPWMNVTSLDQCGDTYQKFKKLIDDVIFIPYSVIQKNEEFFDFAEDFAVATGDPEFVKQNSYRECFDLVKEGRNITDLFATIRGLIEDMVRGGLSEGLTFIEQLLTHKDFQMPKYNEEFDTRLEQTCGWRKDFSDSLRRKADKEKDKIIRGHEAISNIETIINHLKVTYRGLLRTFMTESLFQYLAKYITKHELARQFLSENNVTERETFSRRILDSQDLEKQYYHRFNEITIKIIQGYGNLREDRPIIINDSSAQRLELVRKALTVDDLTDLARAGDVRGIIDKIVYMIYVLLVHVNDHIMGPAHIIQDKLRRMETNLREYQDSIKVDSQFYL